MGSCLFAWMLCRGIGEREGSRGDLREELGSRRRWKLGVAAGSISLTISKSGSMSWGRQNALRDR